MSFERDVIAGKFHSRVRPFAVVQLILGIIKLKSNMANLLIEAQTRLGLRCVVIFLCNFSF